MSGGCYRFPVIPVLRRLKQTVWSTLACYTSHTGSSWEPLPQGITWRAIEKDSQLQPWTSTHMHLNTCTCVDNTNVSTDTCTYQKPIRKGYFKNTFYEGQWNGLAGKGACCQAQWSEFDLQKPHSGRRKLTPLHCLLTATCGPWRMYPYIHSTPHK